MSTTQQQDAPKCTAADGLAEIFNVPGHPLLVRAVDFNRLHAENETLRAGYAAARLEIESLKSQSAAQQPDIENLRKALQFYAGSEHFIKSDGDAWDTVSGEPQNYWCDEAGTATVEDGSIARLALSGQPVQFEDDTPQSEQPGAAYAAQDSEHQLAIMEGERNASLDAYSRVVTITSAESRLYERAFTSGWDRRDRLASYGQAPAQAAPAAVETDPCPGCIPGGYCRTPKCGRLIVMNAAKNAAPAAVAGRSEDVQRARQIAAVAQRWIGDRTHLGALVYLDDLAWALKTLAAAPTTQPTDRHALQAEGKHPAPCARFCEANAFRTDRRSDTALIRQLLEALQASSAALWETKGDPETPVTDAVNAARARLEGKS